MKKSGLAITLLIVFVFLNGAVFGQKKVSSKTTLFDYGNSLVHTFQIYGLKLINKNAKQIIIL